MSEFSQLMAEMIARSKLPITAGGRRSSVAGGGAGMGLVHDGRETAVAVDLKGIEAAVNKIRGIPTPEERAAIMKEGDATYESWKVLAATKTPEDLQIFEAGPSYQTNMERFAKVKHPQVIESGRRTSLGYPIYTWVPGPPDLEKWKTAMKVEMARRAGVGTGTGEMPPEIKREFTTPPTQVEVMSGLAGEGPRKTFVDTSVGIAQVSRERTEKEQKQILEEKADVNWILAGKHGKETADTYITNIRKMNDPQLHPETIKSLQAANELHLAQAAESRSRATLEPIKAMAMHRESEAHAKLMVAQHDEIRAKIKVMQDPSLQKMSPENRAAITEASKAFTQGLFLLEKQYAPVAGMPTMDYKNSYEKLSRLSEFADRHATAVGDIVQRSRDVAATLEYFADQVARYEQEMYTPKVTQEAGWGGGGALQKEKEDAEKKMMTLMKKVVDQHERFAGSEGSLPIASRYYDVLNRIKQGTSKSLVEAFRAYEEDRKKRQQQMSR